MDRSQLLRVVFVFAVTAGIPRSVMAVLPFYDHVVIVVEENRSYSQIVGSAAAPYINGTLVAQGMSFTNFHAITHPSQANYLYMFSGSDQDLLDDTCPWPDAPFSTPNLGANLIAAGQSFGGYSEGMPSVGYTDCKIAGNTGGYRRRHNPWVNWQYDAPLPANGLPASVNMRFTSFPSSFSQLPRVSFVVPTLDNDMHDGSVSTGDTWLRTNIDPYYQWAKTHNSLLILTFDEDAEVSGGSAGNDNRIATVFAGAHVAPGQNNMTWTLENLLRTIEDMYGAAHAGNAAQARPIIGAFASDPAVRTRSFQTGVSGYAGGHDTLIRQDAPNSTYGTDALLTVDLDDNSAAGNQPVQSLVRFDGIIGVAQGQIPPGATIASAKLLVRTDIDSAADSNDRVALHRMARIWSESVTWSSFGAGVVADGVVARAAADYAVRPTFEGNSAIFDVSDAVQSFANGAANNGWAILPSGGDGWEFASNEFATVALRPKLEATYLAPRRGDANFDGLVTVADYSIWRGHYGACNLNEGGGDASGDGCVTAADYTLWADAYNSLAPQLVPEPATATLSWIAALGVCAAIRRRR